MSLTTHTVVLDRCSVVAVARELALARAVALAGPTEPAPTGPASADRSVREPGSEPEQR